MAAASLHGLARMGDGDSRGQPTKAKATNDTEFYRARCAALQSTLLQIFDMSVDANRLLKNDVSEYEEQSKQGKVLHTSIVSTVRRWQQATQAQLAQSNQDQQYVRTLRSRLDQAIGMIDNLHRTDVGKDAVLASALQALQHAAPQCHEQLVAQLDALEERSSVAIEVESATQAQSVGTANKVAFPAQVTQFRAQPQQAGSASAQTFGFFNKVLPAQPTHYHPQPQSVGLTRTFPDPNQPANQHKFS